MGRISYWDTASRKLRYQNHVVVHIPPGGSRDPTNSQGSRSIARKDAVSREFGLACRPLNSDLGADPTFQFIVRSVIVLEDRI